MAPIPGPISPVVCRPDKSCIVVADELVAAQAMTLATDLTSFTAGAMFETALPWCRNPASNDCPEWDLEGIARDGETLYVTGSMGFKRKRISRDDGRWVVAAITLGPDDKPVGKARIQTDRAQLARIFAGHAPDIARFIDTPLQCGGLNIEALGTRGGKLFFGLRSPSERKTGIAFIVEADAASTLGGQDALQAKLHRLQFKRADGKPARHVGIRAIERLGESWLVVTGEAGVSLPKKEVLLERMKNLCDANPAAYNNAPAKPGLAARLWLWSPGSAPKEIGAIGGAYAGKKLEGIATIAEQGPRVDLLLTFDDPENVSPFAVLKGVTLPQ
jgi:hypothetical protein